MCTQHKSTQDGSNKLPAKKFDFNLFRLFAGLGEHLGKQGWLPVGEDCVHALLNPKWGLSRFTSNAPILFLSLVHFQQL
jgi:hypothetical protein